MSGSCRAGAVLFSPTRSHPIRTLISPRTRRRSWRAPSRQPRHRLAQGRFPSRLHIPEEARRRAAELVATPKHGAPLVGIQPAAGRRIKEWDPSASRK